jgi:hypothetical protein
MTMHLEGPWLSTTGKKKTKRKFASVKEASEASLLKLRQINSLKTNLYKGKRPRGLSIMEFLTRGF